VTVKLCPATFSVPVRPGPLLAAALNTTDPLPVPDPPDVIVSQPAPLVAVHPQLAVVETATVFPEEAAADIDRVVGVSV
jgi:hypothetical protein